MRDKLRWLIQYPGESYTEFFPDYQDISFDDSIYKKKFFRRNLKVDLTLRKDDFANVWDLELTNDPCIVLPIKVQLFDSNTAQYVDKHTGFISLKKGDYDANKCTAIFNPDASDIYDCLVESEKNTIDLFQIETRYEVDTIIGAIETINQSYTLQSHDGFNTVFSPQLSAVDKWGVTFRDLIVTEKEENQVIETTIKVIEKYTRQYIDQVAQPAPGWVNVGGNKWVQSVPIRLESTRRNTENNDEPENYIYETTDYFTWTYSIVDFEADNAIKFIDVIPLLIDCGKTIISNFFDLNADATNPDNIAYQFASDHLQNLHLFQASDIINADASQNATKFEVKNGEFLDDVLEYFDLELYFDEAADAFRLEHVSYRQALRGADFLTERWDDIKKAYKYKYDTEDRPSEETFKFKFDTASAIFDENTIKYDINCTNGNDDPLRLKNIVTNVSEVYNNDKYKEINFLTSAVFLELLDGVIVSDNGVLNYNLSFRAIIQALHVHNKPVSEGLINEVLTTFESTRPTKLQSIEVTLGINQFFDNYSPLKKYKTQLGWGTVKSSQYNPKTKKLTIKLLH